VVRAKFPAWQRIQGRGRVLLLLVLVAIVVVGTLGYIERHNIRLLFDRSDNPVGGVPGSVSLRLPSGFQASIWASGLNIPRFLVFGPDGTLYVADRGSGTIVALSDPGHTGHASERTVVASGLEDPTSVIYHDGALYVGETTRITRLTLGPDHRATARQVIVPNLPGGGQHTSRTVLIGPDNRIYVSIGSTCNNCVETDPHRAAIWVYNLDGSGGHLYAKGLRNAVGLAVNPWNQQVWATNNGRDYMGDNEPPDTVYQLIDGGNYGWPFCHAGTIIDPDLGHAGSCDGVVQPLIRIQAHSAPLGLAFYTASQFPASWHGLFIALHGSWNRTVPTGYKVVFVPLDAHGEVAGAPRDFATGWLTGGSDAPGRPVGLAVGPDGALYVTDDRASLIYRISYHQAAQ